MPKPSSPRRRTQAAVGLTLAAGLVATGLTVAFADGGHPPSLATDDQVVEVQAETASFVAEVDRIDAVTDYAVLDAARRYSIAAYAQALERRDPGGGSSILAAIRACESGGDYRAVSASGTYRGAYQFDVATWRAVGGHGDPAAAPPAEQDRRAQMLYDRSGSSPWPVCG
jgi:hypothetical protein